MAARGTTWPARLVRFRDGFVAGPAYPASAGDRRTIGVFGLELPLRATVAITAVTILALADFTRLVIPADIQALGRSPEALRYQALERLTLFGLVPVVIVVGAFRDRLSAYGLTLGDWRWGLGLAVAGCAVMTPIIAVAGSTADFRAYYGGPATSLGAAALTNAIDVIPAEFLFRGFLMFTLIRAIGPFGLVVSQVPFVFTHIGKPELELYSTIFGGAVFGWLDWRTRSIWWSALGHTYILTLVTVAAGGAGAP